MNFIILIFEVDMDNLKEIEGEDGLFMINKVKILYELIPLENERFFIKKNIDTRKIDLLQVKKQKLKNKYKTLAKYKEKR